MVFRKSYGRKTLRRRRPVLRRRLFKRKRLPMARMPRQLVPQPRHSIALDWDQQTISSTPIINNNLLGLTQGLDFFNRTGDEVFVKGLKYDGLMVGNVSTSWQSMRLDFVWDSEPAAGTPTFGQIYSTTAGSVLSQNFIFLNPDGLQRFKIMKSYEFFPQQYLKDSTSPATITNGLRHIKGYIKINKKIRYNTNSFSSPWQGGNLITVAWSNVTTNDPQITLFTDLCFVCKV